jgi:hypothetical protein
MSSVQHEAFEREWCGIMDFMKLANTPQENPVAKMEQPESSERLSLETDEDSSPVAGVVGTDIVQQDQHNARGIPVLQPPPGYVFDPDLQSYAPDQNMPGWMTQDGAQAADSHRNAYMKGKQDAVAEKAQHEINSGVEQAVQESQMQQAQQGAPPTPPGVMAPQPQMPAPPQQQQPPQPPRAPAAALQAAITPKPPNAPRLS